MSVIKLAGFTGEAPRITPRLLPATGAQAALDVRLENGELGPYRKLYPEFVMTGIVAGTVKTIYRHLGEWLYWTSAVHAAPGPVAQERLYYTGDGAPKMRVAGVVYPLKVTAPTAAPVATLGGAPGTPSYTTLYVYTYVTGFGEETEPSPVSNAVLTSSGITVTLTGFSAPVAGRNITTRRIYRSQTGTAGGAVLYFVGEQPIASTSFVDTVAANNFVEPLPSADYNTPPDTLRGLVSMPNGMMAGYDGKDLYFCEPYIPHAWPQKYVLTADYEITGLACYGTTLVVGTTGYPYLVGGSSPAVMTMEKMELNMPCLNVQGMVDLGYSIAYPSHDGLVVSQGGAASIPTTQLFTRDQWLRYDPETMVCGQFYGRFFGSYRYVDTDSLTYEGTLIIDLTGDQPFLIRSQYRADAMFYDVKSGSLFMAVGNTIYEWDSSKSINSTYTWRSKEFVLPAPTSFGALMFELDQRGDPDAINTFAQLLAQLIAANNAIFASGKLEGTINQAAINGYGINDDALNLLPSGPSAVVNIYADGELYDTVTEAGEMQRLVGGKLARIWAIEVISNTNIIELNMAGTAMELRNV